MASRKKTSNNEKGPGQDSTPKNTLTVTHFLQLGQTSQDQGREDGRRTRYLLSTYTSGARRVVSGASPHTLTAAEEGIERDSMATLCAPHSADEKKKR